MIRPASPRDACKAAALPTAFGAVPNCAAFDTLATEAAP